MPQVGDTAWQEGRSGEGRRPWSAWRFGTRHPEHVVVHTVGTHKQAPEADDDGTPGMVETVGRASGCFACPSHPGVVWEFRPAPNGEGTVPVRLPCPACPPVTED